MFVKRTTGTPTQAEILELEQVLIVEQDRAAAVLEAGQSTIVVGEPVNDQGAPEVPRILQAQGELDSYYGGFSSSIGAAADGFEGNLYAHLFPLRFPELIIIAPDLEAGEVTLTGTRSSPTKVPAGTLLADGAASVWATLEDADFAGTGYSESHTVRVRHISGASSALAAAVTTVSDATLALWLTSTNTLALAAVDLDTAYEDAIDVALDESTAAVAGTLIFACRHSAAVFAKLKAHVADASEGGRGRLMVYSPPIGTSQATAIGSGTTGVAAGRSDRYLYAWPGVSWLFTRYDSTNPITSHFDAWAACVIANTNPEESPGQVTPILQAITGTEAGIVCSRTFYKAMKAAGIMAYNATRTAKKCIYSAVTTSLTAGKEPIEQRRISDLIQDSLSGYLADFKDKPLTQTNRDGASEACEGFLQGMQDDERIERYAVDTDSVNTAENLALGIWYIRILVRRIAAAKAIVLLASIGADVVISEG